jgi:hypothetical protein
MLVIGIRVDEGLNDGDHSQERKRSDARREPEEEENRDRQLLHHGDTRCDRRIQQGDAILLLKEANREFPGLVFEQTCLEKTWLRHRCALRVG